MQDNKAIETRQS